MGLGTLLRRYGLWMCSECPSGVTLLCQNMDGLTSLRRTFAVIWTYVDLFVQACERASLCQIMVVLTTVKI